MPARGRPRDNSFKRTDKSQHTPLGFEKSLHGIKLADSPAAHCLAIPHTHTGGKVARPEINQDGAPVDDARRQHGREQHQRAAVLEQLGVLQHVVLGAIDKKGNISVENTISVDTRSGRFVACLEKNELSLRYLPCF